MAFLLEVLGYIVVLFIALKFFKSLATLLYELLLAKPLDVSKLGGDWALVTGATDGIGKAYAFALAERGLNIVLVSRSLDKLNDVANKIEEKNKGKVRTQVIDVDFSSKDEEYVPRITNKISGLKISVLVNNVGMSYEYPMPFLDMEGGSDLVHKLVNVNLTSLNAMTRIVLPQMVDRKNGVVINIGSLSAKIPTPMYSVYAASKAYVGKLTESLAMEYRDKGITFQCVNPGYVVSKMSKLKKPSLMAPTPERFVSSALSRLGIQRETFGYWSHDVMASVINALPSSIAENLSMMHISTIRKKALKKKEKTQ